MNVRPDAVVAPAAPRAAASPAPDPRPIIDEVSLEKREVCAGEENLISVRAHSANGDDAHLHYVIAGVPGNPVPVRAHTADDGPRPPRQVTVFGRGNAARTLELPTFIVKDCGPRPSVIIERRALPNRPDDVGLSVSVVNPPPDLAGARYEWDFGDGEQTVTSEPYAVHSYAKRPVSGIYAQFLVKVAVVAPGTRLIGRRALELLNRSQQVLLERGVVLIEAELTPTFPELDADGNVRQRVRLHHRCEGDVRLERVVVEQVHSQAGATTRIEEPAAALDGITSISAGAGIELPLSLDKERDLGIQMRTYSLLGECAGRPARGSFAAMRPPPPPTRERHQPVTSPELQAKILEARRLLGKPLVSAQELWDLERRGAFTSLARPRVDGVRRF